MCMSRRWLLEHLLEWCLISVWGFCCVEFEENEEAEKAAASLYGKERVPEVKLDLTTIAQGLSEPEAGWLDLFSTRYWTVVSLANSAEVIMDSPVEMQTEQPEGGDNLPCLCRDQTKNPLISSALVFTALLLAARFSEKERPPQFLGHTHYIPLGCRAKMVRSSKDVRCERGKWESGRGPVSDVSVRTMFRI
ncbi:hypothetical protein Droror1_Dr00018672 [Drosera rotundifolia]